MRREQFPMDENDANVLHAALKSYIQARNFDPLDDFQWDCLKHARWLLERLTVFLEGPAE